MEEDCAICLERLDKLPAAKLGDCIHKYHIKCMFKWTQQGKDKCPLCRTSMDTRGSTIQIPKCPKCNHTKLATCLVEEVDILFYICCECRFVEDHVKFYD